MPFEILTVIEGLVTAASLLPSDFERKYRTLAHATTLQLVSALEASVLREPFSVENDEKKQFLAAKSQLVELISNAPEPGYPLHESLKPVLTAVLSVSRSLRTGSTTRSQVVELIEQLRANVGVHHQTP